MSLPIAKKFWFDAERRSASINEVGLELLFGINPISDDELKKLIEKRPDIWSRFETYLGKRGKQMSGSTCCEIVKVGGKQCSDPATALIEISTLSSNYTRPRWCCESHVEQVLDDAITIGYLEDLTVTPIDEVKDDTVPLDCYGNTRKDIFGYRCCKYLTVDGSPAIDGNDGPAKQCPNPAVFWVVNPQGKITPGGYVCEQHAIETIEEYNEKLADEGLWSLEKIDDTPNDDSRILCQYPDCREKATVSSVVNLYASRDKTNPTGTAIYYSCDKHNTRKVGDETDMSRVVEVRELSKPIAKDTDPMTQLLNTVESYVPPSIIQTLDTIAIAENEIELAMERHPDHAVEIWSAFKLLTPLPVMVGKEKAYRSHCQQVLNLTANGRDRPLATWAELCLMFSQASLIAPLNRTWHCAYWVTFNLAFPDESNKAGNDVWSEYEHEQAKEVIGELSRKIVKLRE